METAAFIADLHCHTTASDGSLSARQLYERAAAQNVALLAITDHDTVAGYRSLLEASPKQGPRLLSGIEYSAQWRGKGVHVVGLGIDAEHCATRDAVARQSAVRDERAALIGAKLERLGFHGAYAGARERAADGQIGRPHFARFLVDTGVVANFEQAFSRFLGNGKVGDVRVEWPRLEEVVQWIGAAGGVAVLAHPLKYPLSNGRLRNLLGDFKTAGGTALEVLSGRQSPDKSAFLARLCREFDLLASCGSDFHAPGMAWHELGCAGPLPRGCQPVWESLI